MVCSARACGFVGALVCLTSSAALPEVEDSLLLLQLAKKFRIENNERSCTPLKNQGGTYFSVEVCIGTPPQCFDTVADTGSDSLIIPSCICGESPGAGCSPDEKCFRGTNKSSTFRIPDEPLGTSITYGSGTVSAIIATDKVKVGHIETIMKDGVLLMIDRSQLQLDGPFEGILGLGIPQGGQQTSLMQQIPVQDILRNMSRGPHDDRSAGVDPFSADILCQFFPEMCQETASGSSSSGNPSSSLPFPDSDSSSSSGMVYEANLFLESANIKRFSMCFRDSGDSGALRMNVPEFVEPIQNIGTYHWGIDFRGVSIGPTGHDAPSEIVFCGQDTMKEGMNSPCGIIPDSGTTQILGPEPQVQQLETAICKNWNRCSNMLGEPSSDRFRELLFNCSQWLTDDEGLLEIPSVFFHTKHAKGGVSSFELTAWAWVTEMSVQGHHGQVDKICESAFGVMDYITEQNGPIWIVGTPLFYEFDVGYDMVSKEMALSAGRCQACSDDSEQTSNLIAMPQKFKMPRRISGQRRAPYYNTSIPL